MNYWKLINCILGFSFIANSHADGRLNVFVSIVPQQYFVQQVGGDKVNVYAMVAPDYSPETYEATPKQMEQLNQADIYFSVGALFEAAWLDRVEQNNDQLVIVTCCQDGEKRLNNTLEHTRHSYHDPHIWTNPVKVIEMVKLIEKSLSDRDKKNAGFYKDSAQKFILALQKLDQSMRIKMANLSKKDIVVNHPAWGAFTTEYGLSQISIEQNTKDIRSRGMVKLIEYMRDHDIKAIFVQPQFSKKSAEILAHETGATIFEIDPLAFDYIKNMEEVADKIVQGLSL